MRPGTCEQNALFFMVESVEPCVFLQDTWRVAMDAVAPTAALVCEGFWPSDHVVLPSPCAGSAVYSSDFSLSWFSSLTKNVCALWISLSLVNWIPSTWGWKTAHHQAEGREACRPVFVAEGRRNDREENIVSDRQMSRNPVLVSYI